MKVLITTPNLQGEGGVSSFYATLREFFSPEVTYFTVGRRTMREGPLALAGHAFRDMCALRKTLEKERYDVVQLNPSLMPVALVREGLFMQAAKRAGKRVVVFFHGWNLAVAQRLRRRILQFFKHVYFQADAMIVLAEEYRTQLRHWGYRAPVYVETTAIDDSLLHGACGSERGGNGTIDVLFMSRVTRAKGVYELLDAYTRVRQNHAKIRLTIAGDGDALAGAEQYVKDRAIGGVEFAGYVRGARKIKILQESHLFILPSYGEGMPVSVLEAMACGLPVITRSVGGLKDFFQHERMGFMTESQSPAVFAEYMDRLVRDASLRHRIGTFNRDYAREHFAASKLAERLENIYRAVAVQGTA